MTQITLCLLISKNAMITSLDAKSFKNTNCQLLSLTWLGIEISSGYSKYIDYQFKVLWTPQILGKGSRNGERIAFITQTSLFCVVVQQVYLCLPGVLFYILHCMLCIPQTYEKWLLIQVFEIVTYSQLPV